MLLCMIITNDASIKIIIIKFEKGSELFALLKTLFFSIFVDIFG